MARNRLPYVQRKVLADGTLRFRGWAVLDGVRVYGAWRDDEQTAYDDAIKMRKQVAAGVSGDCLDDACETLLDDLRQKRTPGTVRWYADHLRAVRVLIPGETALHAITAETLEQFIRDRMREVSAATVNADLRALHRVFAVAIRRGRVTENPVRKVDRPRAVVPAIDWFTDAELRDVLAKIVDQRMRDVLAVFALTGVRRSEAARLRPADVRLRLRQLVVDGKTGTRIVPIAPDAEGPLQRLLAAPWRGTHLIGDTHRIDEWFKDARAKVGDDRLHPHALRHTFGTALIRAGVRPDVVMRLMGHRSITTTLRYLHEVGEDGAAAVRSLRLVPPAEPGRAGQE